jgi:hypothetical protein
MIGARSVLRFGTVLAVCVGGWVLVGGAWAAGSLTAVRPAANPTASVTPEWECVPSAIGDAMTYGGSGVSPSCSGKAVLAPTYESSGGVGGKPTVEFSGVNVQIVDGSGYTSTVKGTGNLVLGYDENARTQTGSHDLILGEDQDYTGYGELVGGYDQTVSGPYAAAVGYGNTVSGEFTLAGGDQNVVSGELDSVVGGYKNTASNELDSILGGCSNVAGTGTVSVASICTNSSSYPDDFATIAGGSGNQASGITSSVTGGEFNLASDPLSAIAGGCGGLTGPGTARNPVCASTGYEAISGGVSNRANGPGNVVSAGDFNTADGDQSSVSGGESNSVADFFNTVAGGQSNTASGGQGIAIAGGLSETQTNDQYTEVGSSQFMP